MTLRSSKYLILAIVNGLHTLAIHFSQAFSDECDPLDVETVLGGELDVVPHDSHATFTGTSNPRRAGALDAVFSTRIMLSINWSSRFAWWLKT
jgi:hypothetical protein